MINRIERNQRIREKGFTMRPETIIPTAERDNGPYDFTKIRTHGKTLTNPIVDYSSFKGIGSKHYEDKAHVLKAITNNDFKEMRDISNFYYKASGLYARLCKYMAYLYRYDWMIVPYINKDKAKDSKKIEANFFDALRYCDDFGLKQFFGETALKVIRNGCYYGYVVNADNGLQVQDLSPNYCRSRYKINGNPVVEFNMKFFLDFFPVEASREHALKLFPEEFRKGFRLYKNGKLPPEYPGDDNGWYVLDPTKTVKFNMNGEDYPLLISVIPSIIDLDNAQGLDRKKLEQQLLKIIIQKMPIDKNGDLVFDIDEAQALHNNATQMIGGALGLRVLTTFADVDVADMAEKSNSTSDDTMDRILNAVYAQAGVSMQQFNSNSNIALEKSIANDEAAMYPLIVQFENFINKFLLKKFNGSPKKVYYKAQILTTTIYNYKELAKLYKEQTQLGYSKFLPQIALGQSQLAILSSAYFENDTLDLVNVFIPPLMSSTMNGDFLTNRSGGGSGTSAPKVPGVDKDTGGRKELDNDKKSDKTIANRESMGK